VRAKAPLPGTLKSGYMIGFKAFPTTSIKLVCFNSSMHIKNGSSDGTTLLTHSIKLFLAVSRDELEKQIIQIKNSTIKIGII
jgi:hypothetical protein